MISIKEASEVFKTAETLTDGREGEHVRGTNRGAEKTHCEHILVRIRELYVYRPLSIPFSPRLL